MRLIETLLAYAKEIDLKNSAPYDPVGPTYMVHAGDYGLTISGTDICLAFGLSLGRVTDDLACLKLHYIDALDAWQLEYEIKGNHPPSEIRAVAERFGLANPEEGLLVLDEQVPDIGKAMLDFIKERLQRRAQHLSDIPLPQLLVNGERLT